MGYPVMEVAVRVGSKLPSGLPTNGVCHNCMEGNHNNQTVRPRNPNPAVQAKKIHMLAPRCAPDFVLGSVPENMHATGTSCAIEKLSWAAFCQSLN